MSDMPPDPKFKKPATYQDIVDLPENYVGELIGGALHASPRPAAPHAVASSALGGELVGPFGRGRDGPGGWWILDEPELHFGDDVLVPDLAGWRRTRMPHVPDVPHFTLAPDWICEVLSPSTAKLDVSLKLPRYLVAGVKHAWMVDPSNRTLQVFRSEGGRWVMLAAYGEDDRVRAEPFAAAEIELGALWLQPG